MSSEGAKEACKTFVEQTKLLMSLASAFVLAPAFVQAFLKLPITTPVILAEAMFVLSVLASYMVLGSVTGSQADGTFNVFRPATMWLGRLQFLAYVTGLILFGIWFVNVSTSQPPEADRSNIRIEVSR